MKTFNKILLFILLSFSTSHVGFPDTNDITINGSSLSLVDGFYIAEISIELEKDSDAFVAAGKTDAQVKIIEDLIFSVIYNSKYLTDIDNETYKNLLCKLAVEKLLENKVFIKGLSEIEQRIDGTTLFLKMSVEKSKFDETILKSL